MIAIHLVIKGKVQGVFFRKNTRKKAEELGLHGWVKNLDSGEVEIEAEGPEKSILEFINWCHKGPDKAEVLEVVKENTSIKGFSDFTIR